MYSTERQRLMAMMVMITRERKRISPTSSERNKCQGRQKGRRHTFLNIKEGKKEGDTHF